MPPKWKPPPPSWSGSHCDGVLDVWLASFADFRAGDATALSEDELERARRYRSPKANAQFLASRGFLRTVLGGYLQTPPREIQFAYGLHGKPALKGSSDDLRFNLSHTDGYVLLAAAKGREVGADVEIVREEREHEGLARRYFSASEITEMNALPVESKIQGFFNGWTRKEAYLKARGEGLHFALDGFTMRLSPTQPPALLDVRDDPAEAARWLVFDFNVGPAHAAAVVVEAPIVEVRCFRWPPPTTVQV